MAVTAMALGVAAVACTGSDGSPRSAASARSFCESFIRLAGDLQAGPNGLAPVERASGSQLADLADRAPDRELSDALDELSEVQPKAIKQIEQLEQQIKNRDSDERPHYDEKLQRRYVVAARRALDGLHRVCGADVTEFGNSTTETTATN